MHKRLIGFLMAQRFYTKKIGFHKYFSSAHGVISLIENTEKAIDNKMFVC